MSCPSLLLVGQTPATISDVGRFLFLDHKNVEPISDGRFEFAIPVGGIKIGFGRILSVDHSEYAKSANLCLSFSSGYGWEKTRNCLVLELAKWLSDEFEGKYYSEFDTGLSYFLVEQGRVSVFEKKDVGIAAHLMPFSKWQLLSRPE